MPLPNQQASDVQANIQPDEIPIIMSKLRTTFNTDKTKSKQWRISQLQALNQMLTEGRDEIARSLFEDMHCSPFEAYMQQIAMLQQEIYDVIQHLDEWMADEPVTTNFFNVPALSVIQKDPLGVVLCLGAWNYQILLTLSPLIGAIAAGNCVVVKPGSYAFHSANVLVKLITKYMDNTAIVCIEGNRTITQAILAQKFDAMFFTGSPSVGRVVAEAAAKQLCPVVLELGGKSPCIVTETANIKVSARRATWGALLNSGQTCVRPDYFMVHESVADEFIKEVISTIKDFYGGKPKESEYYGRLVNDAAFQRLSKCAEDAKQFLVAGGAVDAKERYMEPSIYDFGKDFDTFAKSVLMSDEIFGPLMPVVRYSDLDKQVIPFIRSRPKPLALYLFSSLTSSHEENERVLRLTSSGGAIVNDVVVHLSNAELPFGGVGDSGLGNYHGKRTFLNFTHQKAVLRRTTMIDPPQRYAPYTWDKVMVMNAFFYPPVNYWYNKFTHLVMDKKNIIIAALALNTARGLLVNGGKL
jgi:aldehyde dehydrogenase (NAD+)